MLSEHVPDDELWERGLEKLDQALAFFMELKSPEGKAIAHMVYSTFRYGEDLLHPGQGD